MTIKYHSLEYSSEEELRKALSQEYTMTEFDYNTDMKRYKTRADVYNVYPNLKALTDEQIITLGLSCHMYDYKFASACRALLLLKD